MKNDSKVQSNRKKNKGEDLIGFLFSPKTLFFVIALMFVLIYLIKGSEFYYFLTHDAPFKVITYSLAGLFGLSLFVSNRVNWPTILKIVVIVVIFFVLSKM